MKLVVNYLRTREYYAKLKQSKIKWFDELNYQTQLDLYKKYCNPKQHICFIKDNDKIYIYNKLNN